MNIENEDALMALTHEIGELLLVRAQMFPVRDLQNTQALKVVQTRYLIEIQKQGQAAWSIEENVTKKMNFGQRPLFICGYMKSGTTLLSGLLDNHSELIVLPADSHMIRLYKKFDDAEAWIRHWTLRFICPTGQRPFWPLGGGDRYIELWQYLRYWLDQLSSDGAIGFLTAIPYAYYCANEKRPSHPKLWVEKTPRNERDVLQIQELFPHACFIHIIRDPFQNFASMKKLTTIRDRHWRAMRTALSLWCSFILGWRHRNRLGLEQYIFIKYGTLVAHPEMTMRQVANFLDIAWDSSLLTPTINGLPMKANSMFKDRQVTGVINAGSTKDWRRGFSLYEKVMAIILLTPLQWIQRQII